MVLYFDMLHGINVRLGAEVDALATVVACVEWGWVGLMVSAVYWWFRSRFRVERNVAVIILRGAFLRWLAATSNAPAVFVAARMAIELSGSTMIVVGMAAIAVYVLMGRVKNTLEALVPTLFLVNRSVRYNFVDNTVEFFDVGDGRSGGWHLEDVDAVCALDHGADCPAECAICTTTPTLWRTLPCKHVFCAACADTWLMLHGTCPLCRHVVLHAVDSV